MRQANRVLVAAFLMQAKELIAAGHLGFYERAKNITTLAALGLRRQQQVEILQTLQPGNYCYTVDAIDGAEEDGWVFGAIEQGVELYIKLKIVTIPDSDERVICVSFHEAEQALPYPFR